MEYRIWFDEATAKVVRDFRMGPLDTNVAKDSGDIARRHLVCRLFPSDFNDACVSLRIDNKVPFVGFNTPIEVKIDKETGLPEECLKCSAVTPEAIEEYKKILSS